MMDRGRAKWGFTLLMAVALSLHCSTARAKGMCVWLKDNYVVSCDGGACRPLFRAREVPAGRCRRITTTEPFPRWAEAPILALVGGVRLPASPVVVSVEYWFDYPDVAEAAEDLSHALDEPKLALHPETPAVVRDWYRNRGAAQRHRYWKDLAIEIVVYGGVLALLVGSTGWLVRALWSMKPRRQTQVLLATLGLKAWLTVLAFWMGAWQGSDSHPSLLLLLAVPVGLLLMPVDLLLFLLVRWRRSTR